MQPRRVLVTGGAGFIGAHLCRSLLDDGYEVVCADNLLTGQTDNIAALQPNPLFSFVEMDIVEQASFDDLDRIYNLACPASPKHYQAHALKTIRASTVGVDNLLSLAKDTGARFLQASTSEVYGDPSEHPQSEDYWGNVNPYGPRSCYDEGKRLAEALCYEYQKKGVEVRIARIFNTYGPYMAADDGRVVTNFITQSLQEKPLTVYGDGEQTRSFCYVEDLVRGLRLLMESEENTPVNLGNPVERTIKELAQTVLSITEGTSGLVHKPLPRNDPTRRKPDITKAETVLGWSPQVSLEDGLRRTIAYLEDRLERKLVK